MTTINLYQQPTQDSKKGKDAKLFGGGIVYSAVVVLLVLASLGAMKAYNISLAKRNAAAQSQIDEKVSSFSGQDQVDRVTDVQSRLGVIKENISTQLLAKDELHTLAGDMVSGVMASSYKQVGNKVTVGFLANNFADISRQIMNLKNSKNFSAVDVSGITRGDKNLSFYINMDIVPSVQSAQ